MTPDLGMRRIEFNLAAGRAALRASGVKERRRPDIPSYMQGSIYSYLDKSSIKLTIDNFAIYSI